MFLLPSASLSSGESEVAQRKKTKNGGI